MTTMRQYQPDDLQILIDLFRRSVREIACRDYSPEQTQAWAPEVIDEQLWSDMLSLQNTWIAQENGVAMGFISMKMDGCVDLLFVHPDHEMRGVASAMLSHTETQAQAMGIARLYAQVSITASRLLLKRGFHIVREMTVERRGQTFQNYRMEKEVGA